MSLAEILRSAAERELTEPNGRNIVLELRPGLDDPGIAQVQAQYPVPLTPAYRTSHRLWMPHDS